MAEITIDGIKYTNVPNKKQGTQIATQITQSNIKVNQSTEDYMVSSYYYPLMNAVDINWNGIQIGENTYINNTSDLISYIKAQRVQGDIDLSSYATKSYVDEKIEDVIGAAPETLDTLEELAYALSYTPTLSYVTQALDSKADKGNVYTKLETFQLFTTYGYVDEGLNSKADISYVNQKIRNIELTPGPQGADGKSAYQVAVDNGFEGDETAWLNSLVGPQGEQGEQGIQGIQGEQGIQGPIGYTGAAGQDGITPHIDQTGYWYIGETNTGVYAQGPQGEQGIQGPQGPTGTVDYSVLNSYVSITSYNALVSRVEELASWIVSYHSGGTTPTTKSDLLYSSVSPISLSSDKAGTTVNKNILQISTSNSYLSWNNTGYWSIVSQNPSFIVSNPSIILSGSGEYYKLNCDIMCPSSTGMEQQTQLTISFLGNEDYNSSVSYLGVTLQSGSSGSKSYPSGNWLYQGMQQPTFNVTAGDTTSYTLTFSGTPASGWSFSDPMITGITVNSSTGEITINPQNMTSGNYNISANYPEDSNYYMGSAMQSIQVNPEGYDANFHFYDSHYDVTSGTSMSMNLSNMTGIDTMQHPIQWSSSNPNVTIDSYGMVSFTNTGETAIITAIISDGTTTHTAITTITTIQNKQPATGNWMKDGSSVYEVYVNVGDTVDLSWSSPVSGWAFSGGDSNITIDSSTGAITGTAMTEGQLYFNANRMEDSSYYSGMTSLTVYVLAAGTDPKLFARNTLYLDNNAMTQGMPDIHNEYSTNGSPTITITDTSVATYDSSMMVVRYVGAGTTTGTYTIQAYNESTGMYDLTKSCTFNIQCSNMA